MAFRNFLYVETNEDLSFLLKDDSHSISINTEPSVTVVEPTVQLVENTTDSGDSPRQENLVIHSEGVAARIIEQKCRNMGSSKPHVKRRLTQVSSSSRATRQKTSSKDESLFLTIYDDDEDANACHLKITSITPPAWRGHLDNQLDIELHDLHDHYYARQGCKVLTEREKARDKECGELKAICKPTMADFDNNPVVKVLHEKIDAFLVEVKERNASLDRMLLESKKWAGYQVSLSTLDSKVASLKDKKAKLEATKGSFHQEVENVKLDRVEVVSKVVPYVAMELVQSDYMGKLVTKLVSSAIFFRRCHAFEDVATVKENFDLTKIRMHPSKLFSPRSHGFCSIQLQRGPMFEHRLHLPKRLLHLLLQCPSCYFLLRRSLMLPLRSPNHSLLLQLVKGLRLTAAGIITFEPQVKVKGVLFWLFHGKVFRTQRTRAKSSIHPCWLRTKCFSIRFIISTCFVTEEKDYVIFNPLQNSAKIPSLNCLSSFELIVCGTPNLHRTCSHAKFVAYLSFVVGSQDVDSSMAKWPCATNGYCVVAQWIPTGRIFNTVGLRWVPTRKMFADSTTMIDNEPLNGSNEDISNPYNCEQTLNISTCSLSLSAEPIVSTSTPSSTRIDQDTPSISTSQTIKEEQSHVIPTSVREDDHGIEVAHMDNNM
nr:hypothetical protein [Tanacetum cinerariifolium]